MLNRYTQGNDPSAKQNPLYAFILSWPNNNIVELISLPKVGPDTKVSLLGYSDGDIKVL